MGWKEYLGIKSNKEDHFKKVLPDPTGVDTSQSLVYMDQGLQSSSRVLNGVWDGEKTEGELGDIYDTVPDHHKLRLRSYDLALKTDLIKIITGKFFKWTVGTGLKLQSEIEEEVLKMNGIVKDFDEEKKQIESYFTLYAKSKYSDYQRRTNLHRKATDAFKTAFLGGDCLCIIRFETYGPNIQVIDGQMVESPVVEEGKGKDNHINKGIEFDSKGRHVAFWVNTTIDGGDIEHKRVEAKNNQGIQVAWMIYGEKARIDHNRGIPVISSILEKVAKLDRFIDASVSKAEQTANMVYAFTHNQESDGMNILGQSLSSKKKVGAAGDLDSHSETGKTAAQMRQSTSGMVFNLPVGADIKSLYSESETTFEEFFRAVFVALCAAVEIPEEVALMKFEQSYSSSRAAINGWEFIIEIYREHLADDFYRPFYKALIEHMVLSETVDLPKFQEARDDENVMVVEAYLNARFIGKKMPHIDPAKEAKAIRTMLGDDTSSLISREQGSELLGVGDWQNNFKKFLKESKLVPKPEIEKDGNNSSQNKGAKPSVA